MCIISYNSLGNLYKISYHIVFVTLEHENVYIKNKFTMFSFTLTKSAGFLYAYVKWQNCYIVVGNNHYINPWFQTYIRYHLHRPK